jgi:tetratricopeptide (TPR) repeat protein
MLNGFVRRRCAKAFLILMGLALVSCTQTPEMKSAKYLSAGKNLLQKKDIPRAILQFKNALKATPNNADIYYELGEAYSMSKDFTAALGAYRKALGIDPNHAGAELRVAEMMASSSDPQMVKDATATLEDLAKKTPAPSPEVLNTLAYAQLRLGNIDSAADSLNRVVAKVPGELRASALLAGAKVLNHDPKGAEEVLINACKETPDSAEARRILGDFYVEQKRFPEAEAQFRAALGVNPQYAPALLDLARLQVADNRDQEADQSFQRLAKLEEYRSIHAVFLFQIGRRDEAIVELEKLARQRPDDRSLRSNLVVAYRAVGRNAEANKVLAQALKVNPSDTEALLQRGEIAIGTRDYSQADADLNQALHFRPAEPEVHYLMAKLNAARGATLAYRQELGETLRLNPNLLAVRAELAHSLSSTKPGAHAAIDLLDTAPPSQKGSLRLLVERNWALWTLGDMAALRNGVNQGLAAARTPDLLIQAGLLKLATGDHAGARSVLEEALKLDPSDLRAMQALSQTYVAEKNSAMALQKVKEYAKQQPKSAAAQDFLGVMLVANGDLQQGRAAFEAAKQLDPTYTESDLALVQVDAAESKFEDARKRLEIVLAANANNEIARLWLGNIDEALGNHAVAIEHFRKVVQADPDNAQASNNLAYVLAEYGNNADEALKYAEKAVNLRPEKMIYSDTMGWTLYRKGLYGPAIPYLERAAADKGGDVVWKYHLAMAYGKAGDLTRGRTILASALKINPNVPEAKQARDVLGSHP